MISTKTRYIRIWNKWQKTWDWMVRKKYFLLHISGSIARNW